jgi:ATP-dependent exoDNAse (exonuclease V) alpha subunit
MKTTLEQLQALLAGTADDQDVNICLTLSGPASSVSLFFAGAKTVAERPFAIDWARLTEGATELFPASTEDPFTPQTVPPIAASSSHIGAKSRLEQVRDLLCSRDDSEDTTKPTELVKTIPAPRPSISIRKETAMRHLTIRVAWHGNQWNGSVCKEPSKNSFCLALDRVRAGRNDDLETALAGRFWHELPQTQLPPCIAESAGFMNAHEWRRVFNHPYAENQKAAATHGCLKPTLVTLPAFSTFAVPYAWMLKENQESIQNACPSELPPDEEAPFETPWVFGRDRQDALLTYMFGQLADEHSLAFFYCKEGQPLGDQFSRLVVGVGRILKVGRLLPYDSTTPQTYSLWDRVIQHSIRPDDSDGFLLPYHEYVRPTGDPAEDERRLGLLVEIAVPADGAHIRTFSYGAELSTPDVALSILVRCLESVRAIRRHGIAKGPWLDREDWLNTQIAATWKARGAFPGLGSALEALGMRMGTALALELLSTKAISPEDDPWPVVDAVLRGTRTPPQPAYRDDLASIRKTWTTLSDERRSLLRLLSRFSISPTQAINWFRTNERPKVTTATVEDAEILSNPYRICETDLGDGFELPVPIGMIDRGLMPDPTLAARHPVPSPSFVGSPNDPRRLRASFATVLRAAAQTGDTLLSVDEAIERVKQLELRPECSVGADWVEAHTGDMQGVVERSDVVTDLRKDTRIPCLQLTEYSDREERLRSVLQARAERDLPSLGEDWAKLIRTAIEEAGEQCDPKNARHASALTEQADALERVTTRKLSVLVGRAGTGKSSVVGALLRCKKLFGDGILMLAPTGKARVRLGKTTAGEAMTVAQFLHGLKRYDGLHQRPLFAGDRYRKEKTIVIDECSMLTTDDLAAVLYALDLGHVQRLILVGDPNQLPPIGPGRPFADLVAMLDGASESTDPDVAGMAKALARLTVEMRNTAGAPSDTLRLASWYTREKQPVDADRVLSDLQLGQAFNDLSICFWSTPDDLKERLLEQMRECLGVKGAADTAGFNLAVGLDERGIVPDFDAKGAESFQILSPVRQQPYGVSELNRWVQRTFRAKELGDARRWWKLSLGDEEIVTRDKVIQLRNQRRDAYDGTKRRELYLANGEVGVVCGGDDKYSKVVFSGRPGLTVSYQPKEFPQGGGPLELAYCLTVHKGQGSQFNTVFVIVPQGCFNLSRELLYTALTRSRDRMVLLIQGTDPSRLFELTKPEKSETARRNTNLFRGAVRERANTVPYSEHLIHRTEKGHMVRSKSELVIADKLHKMGIEYDYERQLEGTVERRILWPDFTFANPAGDLIIWEHLGLLHREDYRQGWEWKEAWYKKNGYKLGRNLFTTRDDEKGGLDSQQVRAVAEAVKKLL